MTADRRKRKGVLSERERERFVTDISCAAGSDLNFEAVLLAHEAAVLRALTRGFVAEFTHRGEYYPEIVAWLRERARSLRD